MKRAAALFLLVLAGCGGAQDDSRLSYGQNAQKAYEAALADYTSGDCLEAEPAFRRVRRRYPYSRYAALAELRVGDCLLQQQKYAEAIQAYRQFVRYRPSHGMVPYARFRIAESYFRQIPEDWLLGPPSFELDQGPTRQALEQIRIFLLDYSDDSRAPKAREMQRKALSLLARHELYVADYYLGRDKPRAAVKRLLTLLRAYQGSGIEPEAMLLLGRTYLRLRDRTQARTVFQQLLQRYPRSGHAVQARAYLRTLGT